MARHDGTDPYPADLPLRAEYVALVIDGMADGNARRWTISLYGYPSPLTPNFPNEPPVAPQWKQPMILVWPRERALGWTIEYVVAGVEGDKARYRIVTEKTPGTFVASTERSPYYLYRTEGQVRFFELGQLTPQGFGPMGLMRANRDQSSVSSAEGPNCQSCLGLWDE